MKQEWIGSKEQWLNLCHDLNNLGLEYNIEVNFAIATPKGTVDDLVVEAICVLRDYLHGIHNANKKAPVIHHDWLHYFDGENSFGAELMQGSSRPAN